jgi:hypothetical protein
MTKRKDNPGDPPGERDFVHGVAAGLRIGAALVLIATRPSAAVGMVR